MFFFAKRMCKSLPGTSDATFLQQKIYILLKSLGKWLKTSDMLPTGWLRPGNINVHHHSITYHCKTGHQLNQLTNQQTNKESIFSSDQYLQQCPHWQQWPWARTTNSTPWKLLPTTSQGCLDRCRIKRLVRTDFASGNFVFWRFCLCTGLPDLCLPPRHHSHLRRQGDEIKHNHDSTRDANSQAQFDQVEKVCWDDQWPPCSADRGLLCWSRSWLSGFPHLCQRLLRGETEVGSHSEHA